MTSQKQITIDSNLFEWPSEDPKLFGSKCSDCKEVTFPAQAGCPKCSGASCEKIELSTKGTLWTWTTQGFRPKEPYRGNDTDDTFKPYYVGYVELPGQVRVETRLEVDDASQLKIGMEMELIIVKFREDEDGSEVMTFAFEPLKTGSQERI
ncbi:MAG: OB-fold domain-containing protein [Deltaproteobacteria bacterium]|nr:OB-fold domain-containing protein [Deltaproteobacteria bacterium]